SPGAARSARARIEDERWVTHPGLTRTGVRRASSAALGRCRRVAKDAPQTSVLIRRPPTPAPRRGGRGVRCRPRASSVSVSQSLRGLSKSIRRRKHETLYLVLGRWSVSWSVLRWLPVHAPR